MSLSSSDTPHSLRFDSMSWQLRRERSTNVACAAPRESASIPTAPEPAHRSRKRASGTRAAITLKSVSRRRSEVGRTCIDGGLLRFLPLNFPAMTRIGLSNRRELEARVLLDPRDELRRHGRLLLTQVKLGFALCALQQLAIANQIPDPKLRQARLPRAEQFARTANLKILLGDLEAVARLRHDAKTFFRDRRLLVARQQHAVTLLRAASDAA